MGMAKAKKGKGKTSAKAKPARAGRAGGRKPKKAAQGTGSAGAAANKRIATLEAENRRLREELTELRARIAERPAPAAAPGAGQAVLELYGARHSGRGGAQRSEP